VKSYEHIRNETMPRCPYFVFFCMLLSVVDLDSLRDYKYVLSRYGTALCLKSDELGYRCSFEMRRKISTNFVDCVHV